MNYQITSNLSISFEKSCPQGSTSGKDVLIKGSNIPQCLEEGSKIHEEKDISHCLLSENSRNSQNSLLQKLQKTIKATQLRSNELSHKHLLSHIKTRTEKEGHDSFGSKMSFSDSYEEAGVKGGLSASTPKKFVKKERSNDDAASSAGKEAGHSNSKMNTTANQFSNLKTKESPIKSGLTSRTNSFESNMIDAAPRRKRAPSFLEFAASIIPSTDLLNSYSSYSASELESQRRFRFEELDEKNDDETCSLLTLLEGDFFGESANAQPVVKLPSLLEEVTLKTRRFSHSSDYNFFTSKDQLL